jgi:hypothetical protein
MKVAVVGRILFFITSTLFTLAPAVSAQEEREKANILLSQARAKLGGEARLQEVRGLSVSAHSERLMRGPQEHVLSGDVELHFLLPDKFLKESTTAPPGGMGGVTMIEALNGEQEWSDVKSNGPGMMIFRRADETNELKATLLRERRAEMTRYLLSLLLTPPAGLAIQWSYAGKAEDSDGGRADVLDARGPDGFTARLFLDEESHLPLALSYQTKLMMMISAPMAGAPAGKTRPSPPSDLPLNPPEDKEVEGQIRFAEYQSVNGIMLPHRISYATAGEVDEVWEKIKYTVNPPLKPERFLPKK